MFASRVQCQQYGPEAIIDFILAASNNVAHIDIRAFDIVASKSELIRLSLSIYLASITAWRKSVRTLVFGGARKNRTYSHEHATI